MKRLIQFCSVLCLALAFSFVSANAQSAKKVEANIPFDFNAGGQHYKAGKYTLKVSEARTSGAVVYLTDGEDRVLDTMLVSLSSDAVQGDAEMVFNNYDGQRYLSSITTRDGSYKFVRSSTERQIASGKRSAEKRPEIIAIANVN